MFRFAAGSNESRLLSVATRYEIAIASVVGAFAVVFLLQRFGVRDPFALIFLAAIAISSGVVELDLAFSASSSL
jgi:hypothetical protein